MSARALLTGIAALLMATSAVSAANISAVPDQDRPGTFMLIIDGTIQIGDDVKFEEVIKKNNVNAAMVALKSTGGKLLAGLAIGRSIHEKGYTTIVPGGVTCTSMCAVIWLAGSIRQVESTSRIGFHVAYTVDKKGNIVGESGAANAIVGAYYAHLGLSDLAVMYLTSAGPKELRWLSKADARKYDIAFTLIGRDDPFIVGPENPPPWPSSAGSVPPAPTTDVRQRFCVSVIEPPPSVKQDPEYDPNKWLVVREGPGAKFKVITKMGSVGHFEADAVDGDWTHVVDPEIQGWVSSKYVQGCSATRP
jgi:hypothetical protein